MICTDDIETASHKGLQEIHQMTLQILDFPFLNAHRVSKAMKMMS